MNTSRTKTFLGLPRRPIVGDASAAVILSGLALGLLKLDRAALANGTISEELTSQKLPLELAVREYFRKKSLEVTFFDRAPRAVKVTFSYAPSAYWTVGTVMSDSVAALVSSNEDRDDWLYGSLIKKELPKILKEIGK